MPADLTIGPVASTPPEVTQRASGQLAPPQAFSPAAAPPAAVPDNRVVLDPTSDRVVLEYFDATGALINSLPSQRQLEAYRLAASASAAAAPDLKKV